MDEYKELPQEFDLDRELSRSEREVWSPMLDAVGEIKPSAEFAARLEARLPAAATSSQPGRAPQAKQTAPAIPAVLTRFVRADGVPNGRWSRFVATGVGVAVLVVAVLGMSVLWRYGSLHREVGTSTGGSTSTPSSEGSFLPPGKVRHLVVQTSSNHFPGAYATTTVYTTTRDVWLTNGEEHPLMYSTVTYTIDAKGSSFTSGPSASLATIWIDDQSVYQYTAHHMGGYVQKRPYKPSDLQLYLPQGDNFGLVKLSENRITGYSILRGRQVMLVENDPVIEPTVYPPDPNTPDWTVTNIYAAIDVNTHQLVQYRNVTTFLRGAHSGEQQVYTFELAQDTLEDRSEFPTDFFTFKMPKDAVRIYEPTPLPLVSSDTPTPADTPAP